MFGASPLDRERMRGGELATREAVVTVGDALDARPHFVTEEVHVLHVPGTVASHDCTETNIIIIIIIIIIMNRVARLNNYDLSAWHYDEFWTATLLEIF